MQYKKQSNNEKHQLIIGLTTPTAS